MSDQPKEAPGLPVNEFVVPPQPSANSAKVLYGKIIPPQQQILIYSSEEWEAFINEWVDGLKPKYMKVVRLTGASDMGIDVAGLTDTQGFRPVSRH